MEESPGNPQLTPDARHMSSPLSPYVVSGGRNLAEESSVSHRDIPWPLGLWRGAGHEPEPAALLETSHLQPFMLPCNTSQIHHVFWHPEHNIALFLIPY